MKKNQTSIFTSTNNILSAAVNKAIAKAQTGINTSAISPAKSNTTAVKPYTSVVSPATSTVNRAGQTAQKVYSVDQTTKQTVLLNEKQVHEAELVRQLPKDFPIQNWEGMPVKAQLFAIQHSGLSKEDQWTLLNATAPFNVLANAKPIATSGASNTGSYEKQPVLKSQASVRPNATSRASNTGSNGSRSTILQALDRSDSTSGASNTGSYKLRSTILQTLDRLDSATGTNNTGSSKGQQPAFPGQDIETLRAEQRATHKVTNAYNRLDQTLTDKGIQTSSLSGAGQDIYRSTRNSIADAVVQGTLDSGTQKKMIDDASAGIATSKTAPTSIRDWNARVSQADTASKEMFDMLESVHVDTDHLTTEQSYIIDKAEQQLRDGIINGALDENGIDEMIRSICNKVTSETTPPKGVAYVTIMDPGYKRRMEAEEEERKEAKKKSDKDFNDKVKSATNEMISLLKNETDFDIGKLTDAQETLYNNAIRDIKNKLMNGPLTKEFKDQIFYTLANRLSSKVYEYEYTNTYGKKVSGKITTDELIDPRDNSDGARAARYILEPVALKISYNDPTILNLRADPNEKRKWINIDCSGLVKYAVYQINPDWAKEIFGNVAKYQMDRTDNNVVWQKTDANARPSIEDMRAGDLLYWADESGEVVHTAMYIGEGLMVESAKAASLTEVRFTTVDRDGSKSELVQINRLDEKEVSSYENDIDN